MASALEALKNHFFKTDQVSHFDKFFEQKFDARSTKSADQFLKKLHNSDWNDMLKAVVDYVLNPPQKFDIKIHAIDFLISCYFSTVLKANNDIIYFFPVTQDPSFIKKIQYVDGILKAPNSQLLALEPDDKIREWSLELYSALENVQKFSNSLPHQLNFHS
jgi:hypothetical protein